MIVKDKLEYEESLKENLRQDLYWVVAKYSNQMGTKTQSYSPKARNWNRKRITSKTYPNQRKTIELALENSYNVI